MVVVNVFLVVVLCYIFSLTQCAVLKENARPVKEERDVDEGGSRLTSVGHNDHLRLISLRKDKIDDEVIYSVLFWSDSDDVITYWYDMDSYLPVDEYTSNAIPYLSYGVQKMQTKVTSSTSNIMAVAVMPQESLYIRFNKFGPDNSYVEDFTRMTLIVPEQVVFRTGENVEFQITHSKIGSIEDKPEFVDFSAEIKLADLDTGKLFNVDTPGALHTLNELFYPINITEEINVKTVTIGLNTSYIGVSGYFLPKITLRFTGNESILKEMNHVKRMVVRPSSQSGPFPVGFIDFDTTIYNEDGQPELFCDLLKKCSVTCIAYGTNLTEIKLFKRGGPSQWTVLDFDKSGAFLDGSTVEGQAIIDPSNLRQSTEIYKCQAFNDEGEKKTLQLTVKYVSTVSIIEDESFIRDSSRNTFQVTCVVRTKSNPVFQISLIHNSYKYTKYNRDINVTKDGERYIAYAHFYAYEYNGQSWFDGSNSTTATCDAGAFDLWRNADVYTMVLP